MIEPITYHLTPSEMQIASIVGMQRGLSAIEKNTQGRYGRENGGNFDIDVIGAAGELTLAKFLNRYWNGAFGDYKAADVGSQFQVRASSYTGPNAGLILHPADNDGQPFVKVIVTLPKVMLIGWLYGVEGKQQKFWTEKLQAGRPCFLVPHDWLRPMSELGARRAA